MFWLTLPQKGDWSWNEVLGNDDGLNIFTERSKTDEGTGRVCLFRTPDVARTTD